ncbi:MAG: Holliday junction branch migration protein RuvA [Deltaproteobacteria bacterium]|jgi:holliday junction DNA helicase RuvA|nr:Holliday junction branch migration protein RuvA [Deltaproteobacteria bacterium]
MISRLTGTLTNKLPDHCIIDVGGVGYCVHTSLTTFGMLPDVNNEISLNIHTYVREDNLQLFGFSTSDEKFIFQRLISISGVGPKMAMSILSGLPAEVLVQAIGNSDHDRLSTIPGVGKKTAYRIVLELKDRIAKDLTSIGRTLPSAVNDIHEDAISALINLGYKRQIAENALLKIEISDTMRIEEVIRSVLKELNRL